MNTTPGITNNRPRSNNSTNKKQTQASFVSDTEGQHVCCILLGKGKEEGYDNTMGFRKRIDRMKHGKNTFFLPDSILKQYKSDHFGSIRKKFRQGEAYAKRLFNNRSHNPDLNGVNKDLPTYIKHF